MGDGHGDDERSVRHGNIKEHVAVDKATSKVAAVIVSDERSHDRHTT